ncbi:hypothetical protein RMB03_17525 [Acinetobacter sp. V91_7]|uniref:hypothetical protein n=1 Tax=unclassified Acinetobacter TaxID=196816 RepID=UPI00287F2F4E|nr:MULTISPECIES: hypothetical protein [unclassified Acinetobacter]MDS7935642.1 hypothetical protein [Acinetobacter sp. V91_4B]MDS7964750.1 hypothetical protein [Acinetobacter sp. V91_7]MDS8025555.1 hypothetical protein [Acinetobacter sp. V91_13]
MDNSKLPINQIITRINDAAANHEALVLTVDEVKILSKGIGDSFFIPVLTNEQMVQEGKLRQRIDNTKE